MSVNLAKKSENDFKKSQDWPWKPWKLERYLFAVLHRFTLKTFFLQKTAQEAKASASRRIDYILQTLRNNSVKESQYDVHNLLSHAGDEMYTLSAEVCITFHDALTYEKTVNLLVEKLESSIHVSDAVFFVSAEKVSDLR